MAVMYIINEAGSLFLPNQNWVYKKFLMEERDTLKRKIHSKLKQQ